MRQYGDQNIRNAARLSPRGTKDPAGLMPRVEPGGLVEDLAAVSVHPHLLHVIAKRFDALLLSSFGGGAPCTPLRSGQVDSADSLRGDSVSERERERLPANSDLMLRTLLFLRVYCSVAIVVSQTIPYRPSWSLPKAHYCTVQFCFCCNWRVQAVSAFISACYCKTVMICVY